MDIILQPVIQSHGSCFFIIVDIHDSFMNFGAATVATCIICGCFGVTIYLMAIHFIYRYYALQRNGSLTYFQGCYFKIWIAIPLAAGFLWGSICYVYFTPNQEQSNYIRQYVMENYDINVNESTYVSANFYPKDEHGISHLDKKNALVMLSLTIMMVIPVVFLFVYGIKCYFAVQRLTDNGDSAFTKKLQKQLYAALVLQACIPMTLLYIPVAVYFFCPLFEVDIGSFSKIVTFTYALYPAADPLPLFIMVDNYRLATIEMFSSRHACVYTKNRVGVDDCSIETQSPNEIVEN